MTDAWRRSWWCMLVGCALAYASCGGGSAGTTSTTTTSGGVVGAPTASLHIAGVGGAALMTSTNFRMSQHLGAATSPQLSSTTYTLGNPLVEAGVDAVKP